jgi:integrase
MAKVLTVQAIERLKPGKARREVPDAAVPGLYLIIQPSGRKSWAVRIRIAGKPAKITLKALDLVKARDEARGVVEMARQGKDARRERERQLAEAARAELDTVAAVCEDWLTKDQASNRTAAEVRAIMTREVLPHIGKLPIAAIRKRDIIRLVDIVAERAPVRANRVLAWTKRLFNWAAMRDLIETNPAQYVERPTDEQSRERVLSDAELVAIWQAVDPATDFGAIIRLLVLTGARRSEIADLRWSELAEDLSSVRLPASRTKNALPFELPLSTQAKAILAGRHRIVGRDYAFGQRGAKGGFSGFGRCKARLDARIARANAEGRLGRSLADGEKPGPDDALKPWRIHDIRRAVVTGMNEIGIAPHIVEAVVNHVSGAKAKVAGVYNRAAYRTEKAAALQRWADHLERLTSGRPVANVVSMRSDGSAAPAA